MRSLNHRQILAFRAVMISGSMTGAGRILHVTQPAVTRLIRDLEGELRLTLFERQGTGIRPTTSAIELFRDVDRYAESIKRIMETADRIRDRRSGRLRIAAMTTLSSRTLPEAISRFKKFEPDTDFFIHSDASFRILESMSRNEFDLGLGSIPAERLDIKHLPMPVSLAICLLPKQHHLASRPFIDIMDLNGEAFVSLGTSSLLRFRLESLMESSGVKPSSTVQTLYSNTVSSYVKAGLGIAVADIFSVLGADLSSIVLKPFRPVLQFEFSAIYPKGEQLPLAVSFAETMRSIVAADIENVARLMR